MSNSTTDFDSNSIHFEGPKVVSFGQRGSEFHEQNPYSGNPPADLPGIGQPASRDDGAPAPGGSE